VWFAASLVSTLRQAEGEAGVLSAVAFAGGVMAGVTLLASSALTRTAAEFVRRQDDSEGARLASSLAESTMGVATIFGLALLVGATFVIAWRHQAIPRWLAWVGAVGAVLSLVPQYPIFGFGFLIVLFWVAVLSIVLIRRVGRTVES
jgi:membrane-associated protease RseP (regulator of RpoE activity)